MHTAELPLSSPVPAQRINQKYHKYHKFYLFWQFINLNTSQIDQNW